MDFKLVISRFTGKKPHFQMNQQGQTYRKNGNSNPFLTFAPQIMGIITGFFRLQTFRNESVPVIKA